MSLKQPLKRRIIIAFFLMTFVVGGISSLTIFVIVQALEEHFVSQELDADLQEILDSKMDREDVVRLGKHSQFYTNNPQVNFPIPKPFKKLKEGFSEVLLGDGSSYYVYRQIIDNQDYLIVKDQTEFEAREQILLLVVFLGFIGSLIVSLILGKLLANRILVPVVKLAAQVGRVQDLQNPTGKVRLHADYADDEVGQLAVAFDRAFNELHSSLERERLFTSDVSHELRTPLMVIASSCELLLEDEQISPLLYRHIDRISRANKDMNDLVQTFLMLARAQADLLVGDQATLLAVAKEQVESWQDKFVAKNIRFELVVKTTNSNNYNKVLLKAVISNLLRNALHYTEQGAVKLIIDDDSLYVEDTGVGVPEAQRQVIFQAFVRGSSTRGEGLGLGLSLVKRICLHQGWRVQMLAKTTKGSIFHVTLNQ